MNCSTASAFETGNFGASIFMVTYIGLYGMGIIVYFACQFMTDSRDNYGDEIPNEFFSTFHHINERQDIYNQLINKDWVKKAYKIYYSDQSVELERIEEKTNDCVQKYHQRIQNLKSRHTYYVTETLTQPILTSISYID